MTKTLLVRNKRGTIVPLCEAVTPDGKGEVQRDRLGRIEVLGGIGGIYYLGVLVWYSASAWLENNEIRDLVAYKNPLGKWAWRGA